MARRMTLRVCLVVASSIGTLWLGSYPAFSQESPWQTHFEEGKAAIEKGDLAGAEQSFRSALRIAEQTKSHDARATTLGELVPVLTRNSHFNDAEEYGRQLVRLQEARFGKDDLKTLRAIEALAEALEQEARTKRGLGNAILGGGGSTNAYFNLQRAARPKYAEARDLNLRLADGYERSFGRDSIEVVKSLRRAGSACTGLRDFRSAERLYRQSLERLRSLGHSQQNQEQNHLILADLGNMYVKWGKNSEAIGVLEEARAFWEAEDTGGRWRLVYVLFSLVDARERAKEYQAAALANARLLEVQEKSFGKEHVALLPTLERYVRTLRKLKRMDEANTVEERVRLLRKRYGNIGFID